MDHAPAIALLTAPTKLGLRPPQPSSVPGCAKAPEALREAGCTGDCPRPAPWTPESCWPVGTSTTGMPPRSGCATRTPSSTTAGGSPLAWTTCCAIATHPGARRDCSLLVGIGLALARRAPHGLVHIDGHTDFRNPGNSDACASLAGEDLAAAVGRHWPAVADLDGMGPYFAAPDVCTSAAGRRRAPR